MKLKRKVVVGGMLIGGVLAGGVAAALWSASGAGGGQAKALTAQAVTVNAATATADLYPGFTGGDLYFTLTNTNPYPIEFTAMSAGAIVSSNPSACPTSNVTVTPVSSLSLAVGANSTSTTKTIADVVTMASTAPDGCQGVTFTVTLNLTGSQV